MRLLILGGTAWLGYATAQVALQRGHQVTCVARGRGVPAGAEVVRADRDEDGALSVITDGGHGGGDRWDAVIDVSRHPGQVRRAVRDLEPVSDRYVFVSTASVYASHAEIGADEDAPVLTPFVGDRIESLADYGAGKVACENAVLDAYGPGRSVIVRAGLIGGPGDSSGRTEYWPQRFAAPSNPAGAVLVPEADAQLTSIIDVRDLAAWLIALAAGAGYGVFNATGEAIPLGDHLALAREVAGHTGPLVTAPGDWLLEKGVAPWAGERSLPLWLPYPEYAGMAALSHARARAAGLALRPLRDTLTDIVAAAPPGGGHASGEAGPAAVDHGAGLTDAQERELLALLDQVSAPVQNG